MDNEQSFHHSTLDCCTNDLYNLIQVIIFFEINFIPVKNNSDIGSENLVEEMQQFSAACEV